MHEIEKMICDRQIHYYNDRAKRYAIFLFVVLLLYLVPFMVVVLLYITQT